MSTASTTPGIHHDRPYHVRYLENPDQAALRKLALERTPLIFETAYGNLNKITRVKTRKADSTFIVATADRKGEFSSPVLASEEARRLLDKQRAYVEKAGEMIQIDGYLGFPPRAYPVQWLYTPEGANIAAMQQILAFGRATVESKEQLARPFEPILRVVYTPGYLSDFTSDGVCVVVDLENWTSYIMGSDYFGESKKSALRMLNEWVYREGGLVLHAGAKEVRLGRERITMTIKGLSGTGKTTTTFSKQGDLTFPIQDDMVCLWQGGEVSITENGCFAKTFGLTAETEPQIYHGTIAPSAWVENAYQEPDGTFDFGKVGLTPADVGRWKGTLVATGADPKNVDRYARGEVKYEEVVDEAGIPADGWDFVVWTQNGRSIIPMSAIENAADLTDTAPVRSMGILNRDEGPDAATPGIVRFTTPQQAAGYFMLGETSKTSAAGKERGKTRSPFTQPFFPSHHGLQARRFRELAATLDRNVQMWMMNTGYVGGDQQGVEAGRALKVKIRHSSAMLEALLANRIRWTKDPDFGYDVVDVEAPENASLVAAVPVEILQPRRWYAAAGRLDEYRAWVQQMKSERKAFLEKYKVDRDIVEATVGR